MVYLLQHKYCLRRVQKTGESFPVCCIVASQLSPGKGMMLPKQPRKHIWALSVTECRGSLVVAGAVCAVCWGRHRDEGAGQGSVPHPALPCPCKPAQRERAGTRQCRRLEEAHSPFDAADKKWLEGSRCLKFLSWLTWQVDSTAVQYRELQQSLHPHKGLLKLSQKCHNCNSKGLSLKKSSDVSALSYMKQ